MSLKQKKIKFKPGIELTTTYVLDTKKWIEKNKEL